MKPIQIRRRPKREKEPEPEVKPDESTLRPISLQRFPVPDYFIGSGEIQQISRSVRPFDISDVTDGTTRSRISSEMSQVSSPSQSLSAANLRLASTSQERVSVLNMHHDMCILYKSVLDKLSTQIVVLAITGMVEIILCVARPALQLSPKVNSFLFITSILIALLFAVTSAWVFTTLREFLDTNAKMGRLQERLSRLFQRYIPAED